MKAKTYPFGHTAEEWAEIVAGNAAFFGIDQSLADAVEKHRIKYAIYWKRKKRP